MYNTLVRSISVHIFKGFARVKIVDDFELLNDVQFHHVVNMFIGLAL